MTPAKLETRVQGLLDFLPASPHLVDVGAHDALVTVALVAAGRAECGLAIDRSHASCAAARERVRTSGLPIEIRQGDGLAPVGERDNVHTLLITGMGGRSIRRILERAPASAGRFVHWVLGPHTEVPLVRAFLATNGRRIVDERLLEESGRTYALLLAERGPQNLDEADLLLGPCLRRSPTDTFRRWVAVETQRRERAAVRATGEKRRRLLAEMAILRSNID